MSALAYPPQNDEEIFRHCTNECGIITATEDQQYFALGCIFCTEKFLYFDAFIGHMQTDHAALGGGFGGGEGGVDIFSGDHSSQGNGLLGGVDDDNDEEEDLTDAAFLIEPLMIKEEPLDEDPLITGRSSAHELKNLADELMCVKQEMPEGEDEDTKPNYNYLVEFLDGDPEKNETIFQNERLQKSLKAPQKADRKNTRRERYEKKRDGESPAQKEQRLHKLREARKTKLKDDLKNARRKKYEKERDRESPAQKEQRLLKNREARKNKLEVDLKNARRKKYEKERDRESPAQKAQRQLKNRENRKKKLEVDLKIARRKKYEKERAAESPEQKAQRQLKNRENRKKKLEVDLKNARRKKYEKEREGKSPAQREPEGTETLQTT